MKHMQLANLGAYLSGHKVVKLLELLSKASNIA